MYLGDAVISPGCLIDLRHSYHKKGIYATKTIPSGVNSCQHCDLYNMCCKHRYFTYMDGIKRPLCYSYDGSKLIVFVEVDKILEDL